MNITDAVRKAMDEISRDYYVLKGDGLQLPQSSAPHIIASMLELARICTGNRVMEVGTGSGYTAALLAQLVGPNGLVLSVDIDPDLIERAREKLAAERLSNVLCESGNGYQGWPAQAPYDRIIGWTAVEHVPGAWEKQLAPGGSIITPIWLRPLAGIGQAVVRLSRGDDRLLHPEHAIAGSFVPMSDRPLPPGHGTAKFADLVGKDADGRTVWMSGQWLRNREEGSVMESLAAMLRVSVKDDQILNSRDVDTFRAYLLERWPESLTSALDNPAGRLFGAAGQKGMALLDREGNLWIGGDGEYRRILEHWLKDWRESGSPGFADVELAGEPCGGGLSIRFSSPS